MIHPEYTAERLLEGGMAAWVIPQLFGWYLVALGRAADASTYDFVVGRFDNLPAALEAMNSLQLHHYVMTANQFKGGN